jgi:hypothetical protein
MPKMNWEIVLYNIRDAREQLQEIERRINDGNPPSEGEFHVQIEHAFHHMCFAWNIRRVSSKRYANLSTADFDEWSKFPAEIEI